MSIEINASKGIQQNTTEVTKIPVGTTAQRPASPQAGMIRFNTDTGQVEGWNPNTESWVVLSEEFFVPIVATGGTVTDVTDGGVNYRVHTFTSDGTFEVTRPGEVEYLVVAGGGTGRSGGGGAGGYRSSVQGESSGGGATAEPILNLAAQSYNVIVGEGGATGVTENGSDSSFAGIVSVGGGHGSVNRSVFSGVGGSGGGGSFTESGQPNTRPGGAGTVGQGFKGGDQSGNVRTEYWGAGGGGAAEEGFPNSGSNGGRGGNGVESFITGVGVHRAGGGGGGAGGTTSSAVGGLGGGGGAMGGAGVPNTGGGGAGNNGAGGSGIVIVRYEIG